MSLKKISMTAEQIETNKKEYIQAWKRAFRSFLGWPESRALEWAKQWMTSMSDPDGMFYHEPSMYYVAFYIINVCELELDGRAKAGLARRIAASIENGDSRFELNPSADWDGAKKRVETILSEFGKSLEVEI